MKKRERKTIGLARVARPWRDVDIEAKVEVCHSLGLDQMGKGGGGQTGKDGLPSFLSSRREHEPRSEVSQGSCWYHIDL
jgi:hypothetical protein